MPWKRSLNSLAMLMLMSSSIANAQSADSFKTAEYNEMGYNVLDAVNAASAYANGYTGKGVIVGVCDDPINFLVPEFDLKQNSEMINVAGAGVYNWANFTHGTHVAGVVAASKNGLGMHGIAFDAEIKGSTAGRIYYSDGSFESRKDLYAYYVQHPEIKVINNSWGTGCYLTNIDDNQAYELVQSGVLTPTGNPEWQDYLYNNTIQFREAVAHDKLLVWAAGNNGHTMASIENTSPVFDRSLSNNFITVTAGDAAALHRNKTGGFDADCNAIAIFSDLAQYREDCVLNAPGVAIVSANADFAAAGQMDVIRYGTSQAAPLVTGVGALVQQAFPYLGGKQIGDVLLSTANNQIVVTDGFFINVQEDPGEGDNKSELKINIFVPPGGAALDIEKAFEKAYAENEDLFWGFYGIKLSDDKTNGKKKLHSELDANVEIDVFKDVPVEALFGQGIVDAGKAVGGLGAINVRRLSAGDISDAYTVRGKAEKQALYSVNTQGYDSVWSNDIKEIRAGYIAADPLGSGKSADSTGADSDVKDLYDRWLYYQTNWLKNPEGVKDNNSYMVERYITDFNKQIADTELVGLHAGLIKQGEGILNLTGSNTYQGSSIAVQGTLQIDGSVAGDAYSTGSGTITGKGTVNGSLYNDGRVQAGSYGSIENMQVRGGFNGSGTILLNTDGKKYNCLNVDGDAHIDRMEVKAANSAAPEVSGIFITANSIVSGSSTEQEFSGMLDAQIVVDNKEGKLTTFVSNNTGGNSATFAALNNMYFSLDSDRQKQMYRLYALDKTNAAAAFSQIENGMLLDLAHDAMKNGSVMRAVYEQPALARQDGLWMLNNKRWGRIGGVNGHGYNLTIGKDFLSDEHGYYGLLFDYGSNTVSGAAGSGEYDSYSLGLYAGNKNKPGSITGFVSYGLQANKGTAYLPVLGQTAESGYDSKTLGIGVEYAYDLDYGKPEELWHVSPYARLNFNHYRQKAFREHGAGVFDRSFGSYSDNYAEGELGLSFDRSEGTGGYGIRLGYKRILTGERQLMEVCFAEDECGSLLPVRSWGEGRNHFVAAAYVRHDFSRKWSAGGSLSGDWSNGGREIGARLDLAYHF